MTKKSNFIILWLILLFSSYSTKAYAQIVEPFFSICDYCTLDEIAPADTFIERNREMYAAAMDYDVEEWNIVGGEIITEIPRSNYAPMTPARVLVQWDTDAERYELSFTHHTFSTQEFPLAKAHNFSTTVTRGLDNNYLYCVDSRIYFSSSITINAYDPINTETPIILNWKLETLDGDLISELDEIEDIGNSISGNGSFIPNNLGIPAGSYNLVAEIWRYHYLEPGNPYSGTLWDSEAYARTVSGITLYEAAPHVSSTNIEFTERALNNSDSTEITLGISRFFYGGNTYTYNGTDSTANWPSGGEFVVTAVVNNPDDDVFFNILNQENIPNWNRLINKRCLDYDSLPEGFNELELTFETILEEEEACAWRSSFAIPEPSYSVSKPACSTTSNGEITVNMSNVYGLDYVTYKLYQCQFDADSIIINNRNDTPYEEIVTRGNTGATFSDLPPGHYFVRVEESPCYLEEYIDLTAHPMRITDLIPHAPSCYQGINGSLTINSLEYNGTTYDSNNSLPNVQAVVTDQWSTIWPINGGTFNFPQPLTGNSTHQLGSGTYQLQIAVDECLSEPYELVIPVKNQNTLTLSSTRPTCAGDGDGSITVTSLYYNNVQYNIGDDHDFSGFTFNIFESNTASTPLFTDAPAGSINLLEEAYPIYHPDDDISGGTSYWVSYTNSNGCESERIEIPIPAGPAFTIDTLTNQTITAATCHEGLASITINDFSWDSESSSALTLSDFTFSFSGPNPPSTPSSFPFTFPVHGGENWSFQISNSSCSSDVMIFPTIPHPDSVHISDTIPVDVLCHDESNGSITAISSGGNSEDATRYFTIAPDINGTGTLQANEGGDTTFTDLPAGNYWVTVSDGCSVNNSSQVLVTVENYPEISATVDSGQMRCHNEHSGQLLVTASGGIANYDITLLPDDVTLYNVTEGNQQSFTGLNDFTTYEIRVEDVNNCTNTFAAPEIVNPDTLEIVSGEAGIGHVTCWNGNDASIPLEVSGGTGQVYFSLDNINFIDGNFDDPNYSHTFTGLNGGDTTVYIRDINNCLISQEYNIIQPDEYLVVDSSIIGTQCHGGTDGSLSITAEGGTPDGSNYRYYLMEEINGLVDSIINDSAEFANLPYGNYYVNIYDTRNCLLTSSTNELTQPDSIVIEPLMTSASCYDAENITLTANVTGGTGTYTYTWKDIDNNILDYSNTINVSSGIFYIEVIDANNCGYGRTAPNMPPFPYEFIAEKPDTIRLGIDLQLNVDYNGLSNGSVSLASIGGWSFHQYSDNGNDFQNEGIFSGLSEGYYNFWVQDGSGCRDSLTTYISQPEPFLANLNAISDVNCFGGNDGQVTINAQGGIPPYIFTLDDGQGNVIDQEVNIFDNLPTGNYTATVSYTGNNPEEPYVITLNDVFIDQPESALTSSITDYQYPNCTQSDGWATATASGGTVPYSYTWDNLEKSATVSGLSSGAHYVVVSDFNNCIDTSRITLYNIGGPELSVSQINNLPCSYSDNVGSISLSVSGGTEPYAVQWDDADNQTGLTASNLTVGIYSATVADDNNCISILENLEITSPDELLISFDDFKDPSCYNDANGEITASGTGGTSPYYFDWQNIESAGNTGIVSGLSAGVYNLVLTDGNDCVDSSSFELMNPEQIIIDLPDSVFICEGQTATLDAGNIGSLYQWSSDNGFDSDQQIVDVQQEGSYSVTVSNVEGCSNTKQVIIKHENRVLDAGFLMASEAAMSDTVVLVEISWPIPDSLVWDIPADFLKLTDGAAYKELLPLETGEYTIGMRAYLAGCVDIVEKQITIVPAGSLKEAKSTAATVIKNAKLFPNPNTGKFEVEVNLAYEADIRADLFSMNGVRIMPAKYDYGKKEYLLDFNLLKLKPGVYFVNISAKDEVRKLKFVVK